MAPDPRTGAQMVTLTFVLPPAQILIAGAPHPYLVELHAALSELAADLADADKVRALVAFRGVDASELSGKLEDSLQLLNGRREPGHGVREMLDDMNNVERILGEALTLLAPKPKATTHEVTIPPGVCLANRKERKHEPGQPRTIGDSTCRHCGAGIVRIEGEWYTTAPEQADGGGAK